MGRYAQMNKILLVEDDASLRQLINIALSFHEEVGEIHEAVDGLQALQMCEQLRPDVVIIDGMMPKMRGDEAAVLIKQMLPETKLIRFSGMSESVDWADTDVPKDQGVELLEAAVLAALAP
jgi:CheY-like chemotaxis protein